MADIVSEISNMTDDDIRMQIALIDNVNLSNAVKETGHRVINALADVANTFTQSFGIKNSIDYDIKRVSDIVRDDCIKYKVCDREQLESMLMERIESMAAYTPESEQRNNKAERELISRRIIDEAASVYGINKYMSPAHKIEEISIKYNNAFLNNLMNQLKNLTPSQKKAYGELTGRKLGIVSMEVKRQLQKALVPEKFNGEGIIDSLRKQKGTAKLETAIKLLGADAFMAAEAEIRTMYQAVRNMTRISKMQAVRYIWKVSMGGDKKFYVPADLMPSYVAADKKEESEEKEKEYRNACIQVDNATKELLQCEREEEIKKKRLEDARQKYEEASESYDRVQEEFLKLESVKEDYISNRKPEDETKRYYAEVNETKRSLDRSMDDYDKKKKKLHDASRELDESKKNTGEKRRYLEIVSEAVNKETAKRAKELKIKWCAYFFRFTFDDEVFEAAVKQFSTEELRYIEEVLKEAHDSASMRAVSDDDSIRAYTGSRRTAVITFDSRRITGIGCM